MTEFVFFMFGTFFGAVLGWVLRRIYFRHDAAEQCILGLLAASPEPMYGLEMVNQSGGLLARGTVYVVLAQLQERGYVAFTEPDSDGRRRYMLASASGKTHF